MGSKDDVKNAIDIVDFIQRYIPLKRSGRNFSGLCPFHKEKTPSFFVSPDRQTYHCFGCGVGGDVFDFYMRREGVNFFEALKDLADQIGIKLDNFKPDADFNLKQTLIEIHQQTAKYYHYLLTQHKIGQKALDYIVKKRQLNPSQLKDFQIGFAPNSWHSLHSYLFGKKNYSQKDLETSGLILKSSKGYYDRFRGRIMFPLKDTRGNIVGFSGRILPQFDDQKMGKYINSPETPIYHKSKMLFPLFYSKDFIRKNNQVIVVEGELDALASIRSGVKNVVAVKGTAFTSQQVKLLNRYTDTIILCLDADQAGINAAKRSISIIQNQELNCRVIKLSGNKDPDELVKKDPKLWRQISKKTLGIYDFIIDITQKKHPSNSAEAKKNIAKEVLPFLNSIENQIIKDHYIQKLAKTLGTQTLVVKQELDRFSKKQNIVSSLKKDKLNTKKSPSQSRIEKLLQELLTLIIHHYSSINIDKIPLNDLPKNSVTKIIEKLQKNHPKNIVKFSHTLPAQLQPQFDQSYLKPETDLEKTKIDQNFESLISEIAKISLRDKLSQLRDKLSKNSKKELKQQINDVLLRLRSYN